MECQYPLGQTQVAWHNPATGQRRLETSRGCMAEGMSVNVARAFLGGRWNGEELIDSVVGGPAKR